MNFTDVPTSIAQFVDDAAVEQYLFDCLEHRFGRAKLQASDYTFNLSLPPGYRVLTPQVWIEGEVSNGSVGQYFWNRLSDFRLMTADAIEGYDRIGAVAQADAVRDCLRVFAPMEITCRQMKEHEPALEGFLKWMEVWAALNYRGDNPLFDYELVTKLYRVPWIRKNADLFVFRE